MRQLLHGIRVFQDKILPSYRSRFAALADGQQPPTLLVTCSDSRICPQLLTQTDPGELFVLRGAGNLVPPYDERAASGEAATIEYAVNVLGVEQIVVCGHSKCGAISGLLNPETMTELPAVRRWLAHAEPTLRAAAKGAFDGGAVDRLTAAVQHNVRTQLEHLRSYPYVAQKESAGELALVGWYYQFETGDVYVLDDSDQFANVSEMADLKHPVA